LKKIDFARQNLGGRAKRLAEKNGKKPLGIGHYRSELQTSVAYFTTGQ